MGIAETVLAGNGTIVETGGVYLTFSGDSDTPYKFAKVISIGGIGASIGQQIGPGLNPVPSPDLWIKLYDVNTVEQPAVSSMASGPFRILPISVAMFLAWGPPKFPIRVGTETVTTEELAARVEDWYMQPEPTVATEAKSRQSVSHF